MQLDLLYLDGCPHVTAARARLREALDSLGLTDSWREWDATNAEMPDHLRGFASPTILINGVDVVGKQPQEGATCGVAHSCAARGRPVGVGFCESAGGLRATVRSRRKLCPRYPKRRRTPEISPSMAAATSARATMAPITLPVPL